MVNIGFPPPARYGFETMDAPGAPVRSHYPGENRHQSKIYTESNQPDFSQIFGDFTSMQTLTIYRRLLVQNGLREIAATGSKQTARALLEDATGLRDVFSASYGILARSGAGAVAPGQDA
jgi:hypothetical protein